MNVPELFWNAIKGLDHYGALIAALATIAIAGFTWTLKKFTDKLWDASEKQTALSRHALISTEQAFVFCKQLHAVAGVDGKMEK